MAARKPGNSRYFPGKPGFTHPGQALDNAAMLRHFSCLGASFLIGATLSLPARVGAQGPAAPAPAASTKPAAKPHAVLPQRNMTLELRTIAEAAPATAGQQSWSVGASDTEEWQKVTVANGEKAQFDFSTAQAWAWTATAVRGNGTGSMDGVSQSLQWAKDSRAMECQVAWAGGSKPARLDLSVLVAASGKGMVDGTTPQARSQQVHTVVWVPLGEWFTLARSGPRPQVSVEGSYSSRTAEQGQAQLLQVRVLAPD